MGERMKILIREIRNWFILLTLTFIIALLFNTTVFAKVQVRQSSMENTLLSKQQLLEDKLSYRFTDPERGDIIIFFEEEETGTIIDETIRT
jgi:signal peptidase I